MIPVGAIFAAVMIGARLINAASKGGSSTPPTVNAAPVSRGSLGIFSDPHLGATVGLQFLLLFATAMSNAFASTFWPLYAVSLVGYVFLFPWAVTRLVLIPLGLARQAFWLAGWARVAWRRDTPGGPAFAAAWALLRTPAPKPDTIAWVDGQLTDMTTALQASGVVARGLLEAVKGNRDDARAWLESVLLFAPAVSPRRVRKVALEWLLTDAAQAGDWRRLKRLAAQRGWPSTRLSWLLTAVARRMLGEARPANAVLWLLWALAPASHRSWALVRKAQHHVPRSLASPFGPFEGAPLAAALYAHRSARQHPLPLTQDLVAVAHDWSRALDESLREHLRRRTTELGGGDAEATVDELRALVQADLVPLLPDDVYAIEELPTLLSDALAERREDLLGRLEERIDSLDARKQARAELPIIDEWREVMTLRAHYLSLCTAGRAEREFAHAIIKDNLVNYAAWLFNARAERPVANAIFRFLLVEAEDLGDLDAQHLNRKNSQCGL
jgi:hypothetical protein